ncbi:hypothetical protein ACQFX9_18080 [Aliinostoc sp. HNIBRCY26]|uniref:hypothetical protein n=1 Tax=Aliinostoc sp. HNIBRCY26 TaxID=3418997 RepID=UPI003D08611D
MSIFVWKGSTPDGYTLLLSRDGLVKITANLKQTGLESLVKSNMNGTLEGSVTRSIALIVNNAKRSGTLSSHTFGNNLRVFAAVGKTGNYQILTEPIDEKTSLIIFVKRQPKLVDREFEMELETNLESDYEHISEGELEEVWREIEYMAQGKKGKNKNQSPSNQGVKGGHNTNRSPSKRQKHQIGEARRNKDQNVNPGWREYKKRGGKLGPDAWVKAGKPRR